MADSSSSPQTPTFEQSVRTAQIICVAMAMGVATFAAVAIFLRAGKSPGESLLSYLAAAFSLGAGALSVVVPSFVTGNQSPDQSASAARGNQDESADDLIPLVALYQTRLIIGLALLEGAAFFCLAAFLLEGHWWTLAPAGILWVFILAQFPITGRIEQWCRQQRENASLNRRG